MARTRTQVNKIENCSGRLELPSGSDATFFRCYSLMRMLEFLGVPMATDRSDGPARKHPCRENCRAESESGGHKWSTQRGGGSPQHPLTCNKRLETPTFRSIWRRPLPVHMFFLGLPPRWSRPVDRIFPTRQSVEWCNHQIFQSRDLWSSKVLRDGLRQIINPRVSGECWCYLS